MQTSLSYGCVVCSNFPPSPCCEALVASSSRLCLRLCIPLYTEASGLAWKCSHFGEDDLLSSGFPHCSTAHAQIQQPRLESWCHDLPRLSAYVVGLVPSVSAYIVALDCRPTRAWVDDGLISHNGIPFPPPMRTWTMYSSFSLQVSDAKV